MPHELIELTKFASMPAPFSSVAPGEAWVWGDYVAILQTRPKKVADALSAMLGKPMDPIPMEYPFALTVFYRKDRNPHGPSSRPIAVATLEQADYAAILKKLGGQTDLKDLGLGNTTRTVQALFTADAHLNFGDYDGPLTLDAARAHLLECVRRHLSIPGEPVKIGTIEDVHGHPNTGWPAQQKKKSGFGCLVLLATVGSLVILSCAVLMLSN